MSPKRLPAGLDRGYRGSGLWRAFERHRDVFEVEQRDRLPEQAWGASDFLKQACHRKAKSSWAVTSSRSAETGINRNEAHGYGPV